MNRKFIPFYCINCGQELIDDDKFCDEACQAEFAENMEALCV